MYRFLKPTKISSGEIANVPFTRLKSLYENDLDRIKNIYRLAPTYLPSDNAIKKLILSFPANDTSEGYYFNKIDDGREFYIKQIKGGCTNHPPKKYYNHILSSSVTFIDMRTGLDHTTNVGFEDTAAVVFLSHPSTNLTIRNPEVGNRVNELGHSVIGIDVPLLAMQYQRWRKHVRIMDAGRDSISDFITMYVFPNMIPSMIDISLRNRIPYLLNETEVLDIDHKSPIFLPDRSEKIDKSLSKTLKVLRKGSSTPYSVMMNIPMLYSENYLKSVYGEYRTIDRVKYGYSVSIYIHAIHPILKGFLTSFKKKGKYSGLMKRIDRFIVGNRIMDELDIETIIKYEEIKSMLL